MFYIKTRLGAGATIRTEITSENVFCVCPECSKEQAQQLKHEK